MAPTPPDSPQDPSPGHRPAAWYRYTDAASLGIEIAIAVGFCALLGHWLQNNVTHWAPWTSLIGILIGLGAATKAIVRSARNYKRELAQLDAEERNRDPHGDDD